jgi:isoleucyl-tRNA synthetase
MSNNYKDTLNLPNTAFPMKANLSEREPIILKKWADMQLYKTLLQNNQHKPKFILADGPPYANGGIHLGHAVNKILKDMVVKSKILSGLNAPFVPGWDCHGLPIELNVEKQVGKPGIKVDAKTFRAKCREYVQTQVDAQRSSFIRLGVLADWENPYLTMDFQYEADTIRSLANIAANGHLHKGHKPVHWCVECGSALAEAEVEYQDKTSPSIDVTFYANDLSHLPFEPKLLFGKKIAVVIWTTTPWTLPANEAVAVHPEHSYALVKPLGKDIGLIMMSELVETVTKRLGFESYEILDHCAGKALENLTLHHPFYPRTVPIVLSDHVTLDAGTGCVHTAPAHGQEDYIVGQRYHLPLDNPVGANGCFISSTPLFAGEHVYKVNDKIINILEEHGNLLHSEKIQHSYPHCWRHKTPLIFRATQQWFISMDQKNLRKHSVEAIHKTQWMPAWGEARIEGMVSGRPDWCITRQRTWGVPMSVFVHTETGNLHPDTPNLMEKVALLVEQNGIDAWYDLEPETLLGKDANQYEKILDTVDVWFDSGVSHACVLEKRPELQFPADLYLEGSDQHRGWFQSSLLTSVAIHGEAPYRKAITHGFTVDTQGRKMSKSLGNVVAPEKVIQSLGADILRLWVAATDYRAEMAGSDEILKRTSDTYRRIRNTARYLLSNLNGFDPATQLTSGNQLLALDSWIVNRAKHLQSEIVQAFNDYQFHIIYQKLHNFCSVDLGSFYLDVIKDRQYTGKTEGIPRRSAQTALYHIAEALVRWMSPILSFTAEEVWENLPGQRAESVFLSEWYQDFPAIQSTSAITTDTYWQEVLTIRDAVNKALEDARNAALIGSALEAEVVLFCTPNQFDLLSQLGNELRFVLITSQATILPLDQCPNNAIDTEIPGLRLTIQATPYEKCVRCWHRREDVDSHAAFPGLCVRCVENVSGKGEERLYA